MARLYNNLTWLSNKVDYDKFKVPLLDHQRTAIYAMLEYEKCRSVITQDSGGSLIEIEASYGILGDKVGSGKTLTILGLIANKQIPENIYDIVFSNNYMRIKKKSELRPIKTNLILIPHNLMSQWKKECSKTNLVSLFIDTKESMNKIKSIYTINDESSSLEHYDVAVVSNTMYKRFYDSTLKLGARFKWSRIITDEVTSIDVPFIFDCNNCNFKWFITASHNSIKHVHAFANTPDSLISDIVIKNNDVFVDKSLKLFDVKYAVIKCLTPEYIDILRPVVHSSIINLLNAGSIEEAANRLKCDLCTPEELLAAVTKRLNVELHNKKCLLELKTNYIRTTTPSIACNSNAIDELAEAIKEIERKINNMKERIERYKEEECPICLNVKAVPTVLECCNRSFCLSCLIHCRNNLCPMCRAPFTNRTITIINSNALQIPPKKCKKNDVLLNIIKQKPHGKFIIVNNYEMSFCHIEKLLMSEDISYSRLMGNNNRINHTIKKFSNGSIKVILLNSVNYGIGLNLEMTSDIIIYHQLSAYLESQIIGRAQRPVRNTPLNVYFLLYDYEICHVCDKSNVNEVQVRQNDYVKLNEYIHKV